jgi:hypothetical protein
MVKEDKRLVRSRSRNHALAKAPRKGGVAGSVGPTNNLGRALSAMIRHADVFDDTST